MGLHYCLNTAGMMPEQLGARKVGRILCGEAPNLARQDEARVWCLQIKVGWVEKMMMGWAKNW